MRRTFPLWPWLLLPLLVLLLPAGARGLLIDVLGGITLALLLLPLIGGGLAFVAWRLLSRRLHTCSACGLSNLGGGSVCPACGTPYSTEASTDAPFQGLSDARNATINVEAVDVSDAPQNGSPGASARPPD
jgi:hypothetical protein